MKTIKTKSGYTLVELIVIIGLSAIVLVPLSFIVTANLRNEVRIQRVIDSDQSMQQSFIILNEAIRKNGYNEVSLIESDSKLRVDNYVFYLDGSDYKYETYDDSDNLINTTVINKYISSVTYSITSDTLKIEFELDRENDGVVDEEYTYQYSKRE